jgi:hypothetical protein
MLAYISWHRAAAGVSEEFYERALERFHRSLAHRPPSGFRSSCATRLSELPWLAEVRGAEEGAPGYEDWYLLDDWAAVGVLEEAAVALGHEAAHHAIAARAGAGTGSVYRLVEGSARPGAANVAVWVARASGHEPPSLGALLGDGMAPECDGLWRRCLGLGPAPEFCLLAKDAEGSGTLAGVASTRLPAGWSTTVAAREVLWSG